MVRPRIRKTTQTIKLKDVLNLIDMYKNLRVRLIELSAYQNIEIPHTATADHQEEIDKRLANIKSEDAKHRESSQQRRDELASPHNNNE